MFLLNSLQHRPGLMRVMMGLSTCLASSRTKRTSRSLEIGYLEGQDFVHKRLHISTFVVLSSAIPPHC